MKKIANKKLVSLERKGILRRGSGRLPKGFFARPLAGKQANVLPALLEERENGR